MNLEWKSYLDCSLGRIVSRIHFICGRNLEGWHIDCSSWGVANDGRIWNLLEETQCESGDISQRKWKIYFSNRRWTNQTSWRRSRIENIYLDTGSLNSSRRTKRFSWRIRRVSTFTISRLISGCRWGKKWLLIHVRKLHVPSSRWTQSQTLLVERRIFPFSTEIHWRIQNYTYDLDVKQERRIDDYWNIDGSRDLSASWTGFTQFTLLEEKPPDGYMWAGGDWRESSRHPGQIIYGQNSGRKCERMSSWRKGKSGHMKNLNSKITMNLVHWPWGQGI